MTDHPEQLRWKMAVACDVCRRRKVRCDGLRPCSRCKGSSVTCSFTRPKYLKPHRADESVESTDEPPSKRPRTAHVNRGPLSGEASNQSGREHLLLIDPDDQLIYEGPSSGIPLFAQLGLLQTLELSESNQSAAVFTSHSSTAFGIVGVTNASSDFLDLCFQRCPQELMLGLVSQFLSTNVFFPLLHVPSFAAELVAVIQRRLKCTAQYGAMLMSILATTTRLVSGAASLFATNVEKNQAGERCFSFAQDLLRICQNKLDIRYLLALYHLGLYTEGQQGCDGLHASFVAEAIGLAFATGLHRSVTEFKMDPVTGQIRTRLFWALYTLDLSLAFSRGRPTLIRLSDCSVDLPEVVENARITKTAIIPQPPDQPALEMATAVEILKCRVLLDKVLLVINSPSRSTETIMDPSSQLPDKESLDSISIRLDRIEADLPPFLQHDSSSTSTALTSDRHQPALLAATILFIRTLFQRQSIIIDRRHIKASEVASDAASLSQRTIKLYDRLRHFGHLPSCSYNAVSHLTAAGHTLIAAIRAQPELALEHRPDLLIAIDLLNQLSSRYTSASQVAALLSDLCKVFDKRSGDTASRERTAIRVLARRMARSPAIVTAVNPEAPIVPIHTTIQQQEAIRPQFSPAVTTLPDGMFDLEWFTEDMAGLVDYNFPFDFTGQEAFTFGT